MRLNPRVQGSLGELSAVEWLARRGYVVFFPLNHSPDVDLVALHDGTALRVQVKTSTVRGRYLWLVNLKTSGGNQSWTGIVRMFAPDRCDYLFVHVGDGRRWFIPAAEVGGARSVSVGGPKYARFEIEPGAPLAALGRI